jgi:hypothetical protein
MVANENECPFPLELLQEPRATKLEYFRDVIVPHRNIRQILEKLLRNAQEPDDALIYFVFGVTGVGKTRLKGIAPSNAESFYQSTTDSQLFLEDCNSLTEILLRNFQINYSLT